MADSGNPSPIAADYSSPADDSSPIIVDSSSPAASDDPLSPMSADSYASIAADSLSPFDALEERMEAGYYPTSADFERPESPMSADSSPIDAVTERMVADYYEFDPNSTSNDTCSDESLGMVDDQVSIPIGREDRLEFESYVPEPVRNEIKKIFRKYNNDLIDFDTFELGILNRIKDCPEAVEKFKLLLPEDPHKKNKAVISKYIERLKDLDQYTDGYPDLYNCVQSIEEEPKDTDENKEEPKDTDEHKEEPTDIDENKEEPKDTDEHKEEPKDTDENKEEPKDTDKTKE